VLAELIECAGLATVQAEAKLEDSPLPLIEGLQHLVDLALLHDIKPTPSTPNNSRQHRTADDANASR
jgi:hypothetical protein